MLASTAPVAAQLLLHHGVLDPEQLQAALRLRSEWPALSLTDLLLMFGIVSYRRLEPVLQALHPEARVGEQLVREGWLSAIHLDEALAVQEERGGELADILVELGHLSRARFQEVAAKLAARRPRNALLAWWPRLA